MSAAGLSRQQAAQGYRVCPTNAFVEFGREELEQSVAARYEKLMREYPDRVALRTRNHRFTSDGLKQTANRVARTILAQRGREEEPVALLLENDAPMILDIEQEGLVSLADWLIQQETTIHRSVRAVLRHFCDTRTGQEFPRLRPHQGDGRAGIQMGCRVVQRVSLPSLFQPPNATEVAAVIAQVQAEKAQREDVDRTLAELEAISEEQAPQLLASEKRRRAWL